MNNNSLKIAFAAAVSFAAGYLFANKKNEEYYYNLAETEVAKYREMYDEKVDEVRRLSEVEEASTALAASEALSEYQGKPQSEGFVPVDIHAVAERVQYSDYITPEEPAKEEAQPNSVDVLTTKEYMEAPVDYEQSTLIYYRGDDMLVSGMAGEGTIEGEARAQILGDKDVLARENFWETEEIWYFRNHALKYDFEIMVEAGKHNDPYSEGDDG